MQKGRYSGYFRPCKEVAAEKRERTYMSDAGRIAAVGPAQYAILQSVDTKIVKQQEKALHLRCLVALFIGYDERVVATV